jgi:hypothetical protein
MPESLPLHLIMKRFLLRVVTFSNIWSRLGLVLFTWIVAIPYSVLWFTRFCFWFTDSLGEPLVGNPRYMLLHKNYALADVAEELQDLSKLSLLKR